MSILNFQPPPEEVIVRIRDLSPRVVQSPSEDSSEGTPTSSSPVFQFSPEFHRVPSPLFKPEHAFIPPESTEQRQQPHSHQIRTIKSIIETTPRIGTVTGKEIPVVQPAFVEPPEEVCRVQPQPLEPTNNPRPSTVSARAKFFEMEIQQLQQPNAKPGKLL